MARKTFFYGESGETLEEVSQRSCGYPIIESFQGQVGWDIEQPDLVKDAPASARVLRLDDL